MTETENAHQTKSPTRRTAGFRILTGLLVCTVLVGLALSAELSVRFLRGRELDQRISALERLVTTNVTYNKALFSGYEGRGEEAAAHFAAFARTPSIFRPYIEYRRIPNMREAGIQTNSLSYRGPEFAIEKPPETFRILVYGGSFVWGTGALRDDETIPAHLERRINAAKQGPMRYEVINCGETGYQTTQELIFLIIEGLFLKPDLVIFIDGVNDSMAGHTQLPAGYPEIFDRFNELLTGAVRARHREVFTIDDELEYLKRVRSTLWTAGSSEILRRLYLLNAATPADVPIDNERSAMRAEEFALRHTWNLRTLKAVAREYGFSFITAIQPIPMFHKPLHPDETQAIESLMKYPNHYQMVDWWRKHYLDYTDKVISACRDQNIPIVDLRRVFEGNASPIYIDDIHVTGEGYRIIAEAIFEALNAGRMLDPSRR